jgi:hypothetical protein
MTASFVSIGDLTKTDLAAIVDISADRQCVASFVNKETP